MESEPTHSLNQPPLILQDDQPLEGTFTTTLSFASGMVEEPAQPPITETLLSSISSTHSSSSFLGGNNLSTLSSVSTTASRRNSMQSMKHVEVRENLNASVSEDLQGNRRLEHYILEKEIGRGAFGKVHLGIDSITNEKYAIKEFSKSKLRKKEKANLFKLGPRGRGRGRGLKEPAPTVDESPLDLIRGEIAILKKLNHVNTVKLYEVLDVKNEDSMYMVFEFCEKGVLMPVSLSTSFREMFTDAQCRDFFQQIVLGIEYLHEHEIIHRDIKPDNLLRSKDDIIKIVDFGVSEIFQKGDDKTKKTAGSPAFMAPELCQTNHGEVSGRATDIWSMGVTLYCLRYGRLPFVSESVLDMQRVIREDALVIPDTEHDERFKHLIYRILERDPVKRITIDELRTDAWLTNDGKEPLISKEENIENAVTELTEADYNGAIKSCAGLATVLKAVTKFKRGIKSHSRASSISAPEILSEREKVQDADEGALAQLNGKSEKTLEESLRRISLEVPILTAIALESKESEPTKVNKPEEVSKSVEETSKPVEPVEEANKPVEDSATEEKPSGYQVCDMESGLCYWVPASPAPKIEVELAQSPEPTLTSNTKEVEVAKVAPQEVEKKELEPESEPEIKVQADIEPETKTVIESESKPNANAGSDSSHQEGGYEMCDYTTGVCYWVPASKDTSNSASTLINPTEPNTANDTSAKETLDAPVVLDVPTTPQRTVTSRPVSPKPEFSDSGHERTSSGSSSPGRSNKPVGKLSADRLAMFGGK